MIHAVQANSDGHIGIHYLVQNCWNAGKISRIAPNPGHSVAERTLNVMYSQYIGAK